MKIAIIPARGGSKRIPRKNIKQFCGKPMIYWPIKAALESKLFDHIIVSTDDPEIAEISRQCGAETPFLRPANLSDDHTATRPVIQHAVEQIEQLTGKTANEICCIYATAAFLTKQDLLAGFANLKNPSTLFCFAGASYPHPIQRAFSKNTQNQITMANPAATKSRTQDLVEFYHDVGMFYFGKRQGFFSDTPMFSDKSKMIQIPKLRAVDIDEPEDWDFAEAIFKSNLEKIKL